MTAFAALIVVGVLFVVFGRLERSGRSAGVVAIVFALVLLEAAIYEDQNTIPVGLLHPEYRDQPFRLPDILIPVAILARMLHRPSRPGSPIVLAWLAFLAWLATAAVVGAYEGNALSLVAFQAKAIIYLGALLVAASVPLEQYVQDRRLERYLALAAGLALVLIATDTAGIALSMDLPLLPLQGFGAMGSDAATMFSALGVVALALGLLAEDGRRWRVLAAAAALLVTPTVADQRAAFIGVGLAVAIVVAAILLSHRRLRVTPTQTVLAACAVVALLLASTIPAVIADRPVKLPLQDQLSTTFGSYEEVLTTQDRINQWTKAAPLIAERPIYGHGLGYQYVFWNQGYYVFQKTDLTHNIFGDLLLRSGIVGLALFLLAFAMTASAVARVWCSRMSDRAAAFALGTGAAVVGLIGKGMAESVFEKYRLAVALGLGIGVMICAGMPRREAAAQEPGSATDGPAPAPPAAGALTERQGAPST